MVNGINIAAWLVTGLACAGTIYQVLAARRLKAMATERPVPPLAHPPLTLLKPLYGNEPGLEDNLRSFCLQDYPSYQIVFGLHDEEDAALPVVRRLQAAFPGLDMALAVGTGRPTEGNGKIANLTDMLPLAKHDLLVVADSDIRVEPGFLAAVVSALERPRTGIATCLYTGHPEPGLWSRLGALGINSGFVPSVAIAEALGRRDGCYGAALAFRRETLAEMGGFEAFRNRLAEDYLMGKAVREKGLAIVRAATWPSCRVHEPSIGDLFRHEVRWGRTLASIERAGYAGSLVVHNIFWGFLALLADGGPAGLAVFALAFAARLWSVRGTEEALGLPPVPAWLVALRDPFSVAVQLVALAGRTVRWRGRRMRIGPNGTLHPVGSAD